MSETSGSGTFPAEWFRPSTLGEILDRTAQLYRRNFWVFTGIAALPMGIIFVATVIGASAIIFLIPGIRSGSPGFTATAAVAVILAVLILVPIYIAAAVFSYAGLTEAASRTNRGEPVTIRGAFAAVKPRFWRYFGYMFLQGLMVGILPGGAAAVIVVILIAIASGAGGGAASVFTGLLTVLVCIAAFVVIVWLTLCCSLGVATCVVEELPAWETFQRAWKLSQGTRGRIFVMYLLVMALSIALSMVAAIPFLIIVAIAGPLGSGGAYSSIIVGIAEIVRVMIDFLLQILLAPVSAIALVLFYYDQRVRKEGFDIEWMMQHAGLSQPAPTAPPVPGLDISGLVAPPDTVEEP